MRSACRRWWFEASAWREPERRREFQERIDRYLAEDPPPAGSQVSRAETREQYGI